MLALGSTSLTIFGVAAAIALACLLFAVVLRRQVLAAGEGTQKMQDVAAAIQEGAAAYLNRLLRDFSQDRCQA